ncbi:holo-ACP synthase [Halothiobacillus diazotrophicus]|uniref:Holo-[acyl-carrier-protein] synthase n=1 Tax=Halothiobacillus diazotrophicus TaxID=1860122 RepID=A0A191ZG61_9GAMM|nr:holo-ACP synthase [Halothiobacillus diazotrophicus]ANJ66871.1 holo-ACP synthase [Halothiobacillus diazotrophicus]
MIVGIGTDLVEIARIAQGHGRYGDKFLGRVLGDVELVNCPLPDSARFAAWVAKRFAAKEAAVKALGTGFRDGICLQDIQTVHDPLGAPSLQFSGRALQRLNALGATRVHLSLSDERQYALAFVVIERC